MHSPRTTLLTAAAVGAAALLLTGCATPPAGLAGVTVAEDGTPLGILLMCHDHLDGATLSPADAPADASPATAVWRHDGPVTGFTSWPLIRTSGVPEAERWTSKTETTRLEKGRSYRLAGWTEDGSWSAVPVRFTPEDLARLKPGEVRHTLDGETRVSLLDDFRDRACDEATGAKQEH
ncbi:hypothetical protein [Streptomyces termitum]|uniref:hypothetical protein n=1 Tax=Streptomyces termitum TaxID=67368 RepID=UPI0037A513EC